MSALNILQGSRNMDDYLLGQLLPHKYFFFLSLQLFSMEKVLISRLTATVTIRASRSWRVEMKVLFTNN